MKVKGTLYLLKLKPKICVKTNWNVKQIELLEYLTWITLVQMKQLSSTLCLLLHFY